MEDRVSLQLPNTPSLYNRIGRNTQTPTYGRPTQLRRHRSLDPTLSQHLLLTVALECLKCGAHLLLVWLPFEPLHTLSPNANEDQQRQEQQREYCCQCYPSNHPSCPPRAVRFVMNLVRHPVLQKRDLLHYACDSRKCRVMNH